ncbi:LacI family transcriptional regulator [Dictyobacter alpinus]|uniref:LacI family transcriptional regulator n=1 Tax=Dictyobacter alpinus TaxID=2014873 RepID=A0A402BDD7_9CHLR|nr:LacI family DNA-binding transcriptional regulator [Dictyobacter alpinus]GCE29349.1 LacI family transcriptional regulator [Dictyobacter alpinus]
MSKSENKQRPTKISLRDVAQQAGVSIGTASNVFSGKTWVAPETRALVISTAAQIGYVPRIHPEEEPPVQSETERAVTLGLIIRNTPIPLVSNPYYGPILHGAERVCSAQGMSLMYGVVDEQVSNINDFPIMIQRNLIQGLLVVDYFNPAFFSTLERSAIPFVMLEHKLDTIATDSVTIDDEYGGYLATHYLLQMGHLTPPPAMIASSRLLLSVTSRIKGYHQALSEAGVAPIGEYIRNGDLSVGGGYREMSALLDLPQPPSAVFCCNDLTAVGAFNALQERGVKVPEECSLIGYDDIEMASQLTPPLTTIRSETELLGMQGVWHLLERLQYPNLAPRHTLLRVSLIERNSVRKKV